MSRAHHDTRWYEFWAERDHLCVICGERAATQFHHLRMIGAGKYAGVMPRRHSTYNAVRVCDECHRKVHDELGERAVITELGGELEMYRRLTWRMHEYLTARLARP